MSNFREDGDDLPDYEDDPNAEAIEAERARDEAETRRINAEKRAEEDRQLKNKNGDLNNKTWNLSTVYEKFVGYRGEETEEYIGDKGRLFNGRTYVDTLEWLQSTPYEPPPRRQLGPPERRENARFQGSYDGSRDYHITKSQQDKFLADFPARLHGMREHWKPLKQLGRGGFGEVGLFEYNGPDDHIMPFRQVVIKQAQVAKDFKGPPDLIAEDVIMDKLATTDSVHRVKRLALSDRIKKGDYEEDKFVGRVKRIYLEYCSLGTLAELLDYHCAEQKPFKEASIWRILECMVDGLALLEFGKEFDVEGTSVTQPQPERLHNWEPIIHFDLKPSNFMLAKSQESHNHAPTVKIGDFGTSRCIPEDKLPIAHHELRMHGTDGFYTPEQFHKSWDHSDWEGGGIAGQYSFRTNLWQIGANLYSLIICHPGTVEVDISENFIPEEPIMRKPAKGATYAHDLGAYIASDDDAVVDPDTGHKYSKTLIDTCWELLYEVPAHRPSLLELRQRIATACAEFTADDLEPLDDFIIPETDDSLSPERRTGSIGSQRPRLSQPKSGRYSSFNGNSDGDDEDDDEDDVDPRNNQQGKVGTQPRKVAHTGTLDRSRGRDTISSGSNNVISTGRSDILANWQQERAESNISASSDLSDPPTTISKPSSFRSTTSSTLSDPPSNISTPSGFSNSSSSTLSDPPSSLSQPSSTNTSRSSTLSDPPSILEVPQEFHTVRFRSPLEDVEEFEKLSSESSSSESSCDGDDYTSSESSDSDGPDDDESGSYYGRNQPQPPAGGFGGSGSSNPGGRTGPSCGT